MNYQPMDGTPPSPGYDNAGREFDSLPRRVGPRSLGPSERAVSPRDAAAATGRARERP